MQQYDQQVAKALSHLKKDPNIAPLIAKYGAYPIKPHANYYQELVEAIVSQQLSIKAAATIIKRFVDLFGGAFPSPKQILGKKPDELRAVGLSNAKAGYVLDLAGHINDGRLDIQNLPNLSNDQVTQELIAVKGIGEWTAHMFLIFSLGRLDVLPTGDLGFKNGVQKVYNLPKPPTPADIVKIAADNNWHPYESVATWYMWQSLKD